MNEYERQPPEDGAAVALARIATEHGEHLVREAAVAAIEAFEDFGADLPVMTGEDEMSFLRKWEETGLNGLAPVYSNFQWRTPLLALEKTDHLHISRIYDALRLCKDKGLTKKILADARAIDTKHLGFAIGPQSPLAHEASTLFCELTGHARVAFCNTYRPWAEGRPLRYASRFRPGPSPDR